MRKAQSTIIGFILITAVAIVIISMTLFWAMPLLEKSRSTAEVQSLELKFLELHSAVKSVAESQGSRTLNFDISRGTLTLSNNSIIYSGQFDLSSPIPRKLIFGNNTANITGIPSADEIVPLGVEEPAYLIEQSAVELILHYRILNDASGGQCYRIKLQPGNQVTTGLGRHTIELKWIGENSTSYDICTNLTDQLVEFNIR